VVQPKIGGFKNMKVAVSEPQHQDKSRGSGVEI